MNFDSNTPRTSATIAGESYTVPQPFTKGHVLTENEAAALNQVLTENVRNNVASRIKTAKEKGEAVPTQAQIDEYVQGYEFGVRSGGGRTMDPVEREARNLAWNAVVPALAAKGIKAKDLSATQRNSLIDQAMDQHGEKLRAKAKKIVAQRESIGADELELNVPAEEAAE